MSEEIVEETPKGRSAKQIIEEILAHSDNALEILSKLNRHEHAQMVEATLLVALQRARGLSCYETLAAYALGASNESVLWQDVIAKIEADYNQLIGICISQDKLVKLSSHALADAKSFLKQYANTPED